MYMFITVYPLRSPDHKSCMCSINLCVTPLHTLVCTIQTLGQKNLISTNPASLPFCEQNFNVTGNNALYNLPQLENQSIAMQLNLIVRHAP